MQITTIGLHIAKNVFQVHGIDAKEKVVATKQNFVTLRDGRVEVQKYTPDRFPHRRLDRQIEKMIQRLFTKATR
jgi:tRNA/tmRNA/rRNA uracil-C5-methylase (TrmA/RlmC/RlmD family)